MSTGVQGTGRRAFDWMFRNRTTGGITVMQWPNIPLWIFLVAAVVRRLVHPRGAVGTAVTVVATGALLWWAVDEVVRGVNPFRRLLGGLVLVATVVGLATR
jgi:hypothetical protein